MCHIVKCSQSGFTISHEYQSQISDYVPMWSRDPGKYTKFASCHWVFKFISSYYAQTNLDCLHLISLAIRRKRKVHFSGIFRRRRSKSHFDNKILVSICFLNDCIVYFSVGRLIDFFAFPSEITFWLPLDAL